MAEEQQAGPFGDLSGQVIGGRYRLTTMLGQGGMGVVYAATQESLARPVAVKLLQPMLAQSGESILRFKAEAERAGRLAHPHIVQILDFGREVGGSAWIAMELLGGESLGARIERGVLSESEVVRVARETLSALEAAHGANLVHRDLKPDNIFLANVPGIGVSVKVLDFGIAKLLDDESAGKLTATGMMVGTPLYMAPEQAKGADLDQRADLYSLGAVLYEALTGRPPFTGKNYNALLYSVLSEEPPPIDAIRPDVSRELIQVITRAMAKTPEQRFQSAREMGEALVRVAPSDHLPSQAPIELGTAKTMATPAALPAAQTPLLGGTDFGMQPTLAASASHPGAVQLAGLSSDSRASPLGSSHPVGGQHSTASRSVAPPLQPAQASRGRAGLLIWTAVGVGAFLALGMVSIAFVAARFVRSEALGEPVVFTDPSAASDPAALAVAQPASGTPAVLVPVATTPDELAGAGVRGVAIEPSAPDVPDPSVSDAPPHRAAGSKRAVPSSVHGSDARHPEEAPAPDHHASAPGRTFPTPRVSRAGGTSTGLASPEALSGPIDAEGGWSECWPRHVAAPETSRARLFLIDLAGDGRVVSAAPAPNSEEPLEFSSCVVRKLRRIRFSAPVSGQPIQVRIMFSIG